MVAETDTRHEGYRDRLAALATDTAPVEAITEAGLRNGWWSTGVRWARAFGRFHPGQEPFVSLVYQIDTEPHLLCHVDAFTTPPARVGNRVSWVTERAEGWLRVTTFPFDDALSTLPAVLARPGRRTVVRYRPRSRCTIRFESPEGRVEFAKVFSDRAGERSHVNGQIVWEAAQRNELEFVVARPERWDLETRTVWQEGIPGLPLTARHLEAAGAGLAHRMGLAAGSLIRSGVRPRVVYDLAAHFARSLRYAADLKARVPGLGPTVDRLVYELEKLQARVTEHAMRPIHGSLSRTQWIGGSHRLGLVDFDKLALGDPEYDVAAFLTELEYDHVQMRQIARAFLASFEAIAGRLDRRLLDLYAAHERLEKAVKSARAVRPDGDARAGFQLQDALAASAGSTV